MSVEVNNIISHIVLEFNFLIIIIITIAKTVRISGRFWEIVLKVIVCKQRDGVSFHLNKITASWLFIKLDETLLLFFEVQLCVQLNVLLTKSTDSSMS